LFIARRRDRPSEAQVSPKAEWYDRNPATRTVYYNGSGVAPHSYISRGSYTVPAGKKAVLELAFIQTYRLAAATTVAAVIADIAFTPSGGSAQLLQQLWHMDNTLYVVRDKTVPMSICMQVGDRIDIDTGDGSTGGTNSYIMLLKLTEFNA